MKHKLYWSLFILLSTYTIKSSAQSPHYQWANAIGTYTGGNPAGLCVATDKYGNVYHTGTFVNTVDFDPGPATVLLTSSSLSADMYICKNDSIGNLIWAKKYTGYCVPYDICIDKDGNILMTGDFDGTVDFDPGPSLYNVVSPSTPGDYIFVSKLDANGNFVFACGVNSSTAYNHGRGIDADRQGNCYITGNFKGTADFDPATAIFNLTTTIDATFLLKLDSLGHFKYAKKFGNSFPSMGHALKLDSSANIHLIGQFDGVMDFDPGPGSSTLYGYKGSFLVKLDSAANYQWAVTFASSGSSANHYDSFGKELSLDEFGNIYCGGTFSGTNDFDPGTGLFNMSVGGPGYYTYVLKLTPGGLFMWAKAIGASVIYGLSATHEGVCTGGLFQGTQDFDPGSGIFDMSTTDYYSAYILKLDFSGNFIWARSLDGLSYLYDIKADLEENIYFTGNIRDSIDFDPGFGSVTLPGPSQFYVASWSEFPCTDYSIPLDYSFCESGTYTINSVTYNIPGNYNQLLSTLGGCDSLLTISLTIDSITGSFSDHFCAGSSYTLNSITYNTAGTYTQLLTTPGGCDSTLTITLAVDSVNTSVDQSGNVLTALSTGAIYQWVDCNSGYSALSSENNQTYTALSNGIYAVILTEGICSDTSNCFNVTATEIAQNYSPSFGLFPNPANTDVKIVTSETNCSYNIFTVEGKSVMQGLLTEDHLIRFTGLKNGIYFIRITSRTYNHTQPLSITR